MKAEYQWSINKHSGKTYTKEEAVQKILDKIDMTDPVYYLIRTTWKQGIHKWYIDHVKIIHARWQTKIYILCADEVECDWIDFEEEWATIDEDIEKKDATLENLENATIFWAENKNAIIMFLKARRNDGNYKRIIYVTKKALKKIKKWNILEYNKDCWYSTDGKQLTKGE